jgi:uracil-DNA glycosylase
MIWDDFNFWDTGEWQTIEEKLDDLERSNIVYNPERELLFSAMDVVDFDRVRVAIIGQDPYPNHALATGLAFDVPKSCKLLPPTLVNILREYCDDLHYPEPKNGCLEKWCDNGVLLWNSIPTCEANKSLSHRGWDEWTFLTKEIIERLSERGIVFVFLGSVARENVKYVKEPAKYLELSHPSPRGSRLGNSPFLGSRMFSHVNQLLNEQGLEPIEWRL